MAGEHYDAFIKEAFLDPIRSVLIIDDDYPTFEEVLEQGDGAGRNGDKHDGKSWRGDPGRIGSVIKNFHEHDPPLLVDIHDGSNVSVESEDTTVSHLHQCDLLVLDYELDKAKPRDGARAIEILRKVSSSDHFNLVMIYTKETLDDVFNAVRWGLVGLSSNSLSQDDITKANELLSNGEEESEGFQRRLTDTVDAAQYFYSRKCSRYLRRMVTGCALYSAYFAEADQLGWISEDKKLVLKYLLIELEKKNIRPAHENGINEFNWSLGDIYWVRSDSMFVGFSNKTGGNDLLDEMHKALCDWGPEPSRLFLNKFRAEMDEYGVPAQSWLLSRRHALAHWYHRLLQADDMMERRWRIHESVELHSERLMAVIRRRIDEFATRLIEKEREAGDINSICDDHFDVNLSRDNKARKRAALEHNALVCTKERPDGWHLTTGHVFSIYDDTWVCVSPACDMVPSQVSTTIKELLGTNLPFIAVKLRRIPNNKIPSDVNSNRYIFLERNTEIQGYCFNDQSRDSSAPQWEVLYAKNGGRFSGEDRKFDVQRNRLCGGKLVVECHSAKVFCQIRYEYALNLVHKLGVSVTRIGLDFYDGTRS